MSTRRGLIRILLSAATLFPEAQLFAQKMIPAGTRLRVRTAEFINVDSTQAGMRFRGTVDDPIIIDGTVNVQRGADVALAVAKVDQGGQFKDSDLIHLKVDSISVGGRIYQVATGLAETKSDGEGQKTTRKVIGGAGLGAIIGGIAGGGTAAAIGAIARAQVEQSCLQLGSHTLRSPPRPVWSSNS